MTSTLSPTSTTPLRMAKERFLDAFEREHGTTMRVLRAYPKGKLDLRPHAKCKTARELAWGFACEQDMFATIMTDGFNPAKLQGGMPAAPDSMEAIIEALDRGHKRVVSIVRDMSDERFAEPVRFFVAPKTMGDIPKVDFLWMMLFDQIHHRGQFSIYLRMADGKVPSIYGPTADEPWM